MSRGAAIVGYFADGTAAVRTADGDYPAYSAQKKFDIAQETVKSFVSEVEGIKYGLIENHGKDIIPKQAYNINKGLKLGGGISGGFFTAQDFYQDYSNYHDKPLVLIEAWGTDAIPVGMGLLGGGWFGIPGGMAGSVTGAYIREGLRYKMKGED